MEHHSGESSGLGEPAEMNFVAPVHAGATALAARDVMNSTLFRKPDFWIGAIGIFLSLFLFAQTRTLSGGAVSDAVGSAFFPRLLVGLLFILCSLLIFRTRKGPNGNVEHGPVKPA